MVGHLSVWMIGRYERHFHGVYQENFCMVHGTKEEMSLSKLRATLH